MLSGSRGSLQGSSIVSIPGFLPSFSFKNKTRGAVDNACRCASVIIKSRRTRGPVTLIPTSGALRSVLVVVVVVVVVLVAVSRLLPGVFLSKNAFPRGGLTDGLSLLFACFSQGRETMRGTQETVSGEGRGGNLLYSRTNFWALFPEARYFKRHRMISESRREQICKSDLNPGTCGVINYYNQVFTFDNKHRDNGKIKII